MKQETYTQENWKFEKAEFSLTQNGLGQWWPRMVASGYPIIIRDSNPFKTLAGGIKFIEKTIVKLKAENRLN